jgi:hypothetical protein
MSIDEIEIAKLRWETKELGRLENLPPWEQPDTKEQKEASEDAEGKVVIDIPRMDNALKSKSVEVPSGMSKEEIRQFIIEASNGDCV